MVLTSHAGIRSPLVLSERAGLSSDIGLDSGIEVGVFGLHSAGNSLFHLSLTLASRLFLGGVETTTLAELLDSSDESAGSAGVFIGATG